MSKTNFKLHVDTILNISIPDVDEDELLLTRHAIEDLIFKGSKILFQKYDKEKKIYIADVKIIRETRGDRK